MVGFRDLVGVGIGPVSKKLAVKIIYIHLAVFGFTFSKESTPVLYYVIEFSVFCRAKFLYIR